MHDNLQKVGRVICSALGKPDANAVFPFYSERLVVPQQPNNFDCGLFMLEYVARFLHDPLQLIGTGCVRRKNTHNLERIYFNKSKEFDRDAQRQKDGLVKTDQQLNSWFDADHVVAQRRADLRNFFKGLKDGDNEVQVAKQALNNIYKT